jgi:hypothetical protein
MNQGLMGYSYSHVCPEKLEKAFLEKYYLGHKIYDLESGITDYQDKLEKKKEELAEKKDLTVDQQVDLKVEIEKIRMKIEESNKRLYYIKGKAGVSL